MPIAKKYLFIVSMDVQKDKEALFNEVYDKEHVPNLRAVAGVRRATRYRQPSPNRHATPAVRPIPGWRENPRSTAPHAPGSFRRG